MLFPQPNGCGLIEGNHKLVSGSLDMTDFRSLTVAASLKGFLALSRALSEWDFRSLTVAASLKAPKIKP